MLCKMLSVVNTAITLITKLFNIICKCCFIVNFFMSLIFLMCLKEFKQEYIYNTTIYLILIKQA